MRRKPASRQRRKTRAAEPADPARESLGVAQAEAEREQLLTQLEALSDAQSEGERLQQLFAELFYEAPVGYLNLTKDGRIQMANLETGRLLATSPWKLERMHMRTFVAGADMHLLAEHLRQCGLHSGKEVVTEMRLGAQAGKRVVEMLSRPTRLTEEDGAVYRTSLRDITTRVQAQAELTASQERLRLVVDNARDYAIISMDLKRNITSWNLGATALMGFSEEEILGSSADIIFTREDRAAKIPDKEASGALRHGRSSDERWHVRKDGSRFWGSGVMMAMRAGGNEAIGLLKIFRDHTAQRKAQQALEASRDAAEAASRAKDRFLAIVSHEMRTPLTPVSIATAVLLRRGDLALEVREALETIRRNIDMEARLVNDLLDTTRIQRGTLEMNKRSIDLHEVLGRSVEVSRPECEDRQQVLTISLEATVTALEGDFARLQQVFWNLLRNASKFTPEGGRIALRSWNDQPGEVIVEVVDTGIGFAREARERIFGEFDQASPAIAQQFGGLGLGLAIAKAIVQGHGGKIAARSDGEGHGATFTVRLPLDGAAADRKV